MPAQLRPMKLGEILDQGFSIYRKNFWQLTAIAALPAIAVLAVQCADLNWWHLGTPAKSANQGERYVWSILSSFVYFHISAVLAYMVTPAYVRYVAGILFEEKVTVVASLASAAARWRRYLLIALLKLGVELIGPEAIAAGVFIGLGFAGEAAGLMEPLSNAYMVVLIFLPLGVAMILFLWMSASFSLTIPASVREQLPTFKAMKRSWRLSKGGRFRLAATWFMVSILLWVLYLVVWLLMRWAIMLLYFLTHWHWMSPQFYFAADYALSTVAAATLGPILPLVLILLYYDQRVRKEGYDLVRMMEEAGLAAPVVTVAGEPSEAVPATVAGNPQAADAGRPVEGTPPEAGESLA